MQHGHPPHNAAHHRLTEPVQGLGTCNTTRILLRACAGAWYLQHDATHVPFRIPNVTEPVQGLGTCNHTVMYCVELSQSLCRGLVLATPSVIWGSYPVQLQSLCKGLVLATRCQQRHRACARAWYLQPDAHGDGAHGDGARSPPSSQSLCKGLVLATTA